MWMSLEDLRSLGFRDIDPSALVDSTSRFIEPGRISIGRNSRVDGNSLISAGDGGVTLDEHTHVGFGAQIFGAGTVHLKYGAGISAGVQIFSQSDDFLYGHLSNPTFPTRFRNVVKKPVILGEHSVVGANSVLLPGAVLGRGAVVGALTLVNCSVEDFEIVSGNPLRSLGKRNSTKLDYLDLLLRE